MQTIIADSESNAYKIGYFPYTFGQFAEVWFWVETKDSMGQRLVYKTKVLKTSTSLNEFINFQKPKFGKYADLVILCLHGQESGPYFGLPNLLLIDFKNENIESLEELLTEKEYKLSNVQKMRIMGQIEYWKQYGY